MSQSCLHETGFFRALLLLVVTAATSFASQLEPIPTEAARQQALTLINEVYGPEWKQARTPEQKSALATKLLARSRKATDGANRFELLRIAKETAVQAGDVHIALRAVDEAANQFQIDRPDARVNTFLAAAEFASNTADKKVIAERARPFIEQAVEEDDFELAKRLYEAAVTAARSADEWELTKQIVARNKKVEDIAAAYAEIQDALATLKDNPVEPDANLAVGKYHCFIKGNWDRGLPMLALGNDDKLKELAVKELRGVPDTEGRVAVGDGWWDLASASEGVAQKQLQGRAGYWYRKTLGGLSGLVKDRVEKRLGTKEEGTHAESPSTYLTNLEPLEVKVYFHSTARHTDFRRPFHIGGTRPEHGFSAHPFTNSRSVIAFRLPDGYQSLTGSAGIGDRVGKRIRRTETPLTFEILGDGQSLWKSRPLQIAGSTQDFSVGISGVKRLQLCVRCPGKAGYAWAVWVDPILTRD